PEDLERLIQNVRALRNIIVHEVHEVTEEEENTIENSYIQFMFYLVIKHLKPLDLNKIEIEPEYSFIEINKINHEIQSFLHLYLGSTLGIKEFYNKFLIPLLNELGITVNS
ncbi:unnamed protein product, partial [marine sediment metagenome]